MQAVTDWAVLWREIVDARRAARTKPADESVTGDVWVKLASGFDERVKRRWNQPDSTRDYVVSRMTPDATLIDIGAGTGSWAVLLAPHVRKITAVEPSPTMASYLRRNLAEREIENVEIVADHWPQAEVPVHDFAFCSHAMYGVLDLPPFIEKMASSARRACFFLVRAPSADSLMAEAAQQLWGHPHDIPSFAVAYNVLLQMGIYADVRIEDGDNWRTATSPTMEDALREVKYKLGIAADDSTCDAYLRDLLERRLIARDGCYEWPGKMRSALIHWPCS